LRGLLVPVPGTAGAPMIASPLLLALLAAPGVDALPAARADAVEAIGFASLPLGKARWLEGRWAKYRVVRKSAVEESGGCGFFDTESADDALRTVYLLPGETAGEEMTVEGTLRLRWVPASHGLAGCWHDRLVDARRGRWHPRPDYLSLFP